MDDKAPDRKCWELNESCPMRGQPRSGSTCPAYRKGYSCWEFDWKAYVEALPPEKWDYWQAILEQCDGCVCHKARAKEMGERISAVRGLKRPG
jgi:hypothetical protein